MAKDLFGQDEDLETPVHHGAQALEQPLAHRYRPGAAQELIGQRQIWSPGTPLWELVHRDRFHGLLLWGPPGTGKTSMAHLVGSLVGRGVQEVSAVEAGVKEIRSVIEKSRQKLSEGQKALILFLDEIHRLNRSQQDSLLKALERGWIRLIGATTENPSFAVNNALLSRCLTIGFQKISTADLAAHLQMVAQKEGKILDQDLANSLAQSADGDGRAALNLLESVLALVGDQTEICQEQVKPFLTAIARHYDRNSEFHYELISALIKSIRASDANGAVYYLARMLKGGEDPLFIARRLVIAASEDIGNAHPTALVIAQSGLQAVKEIGMPEARIVLSQVVTYLAASPKSHRSYLAINEAMAVVDKTGDLPVPMHLRNAPTAFMRNLGYAKGYVYAHDDPDGAAKMVNLPVEVADQEFYRPSEVGSEKALGDFLRRWRPQTTKAPGSQS